MSFSDEQARMAQGFAQEQQLEDATLQRKAIVGDSDGHWLSKQVEALHDTNGVIRSGEVRSYRFLSDDEEVVLSKMNELDSDSIIEMPAGSIVSRVEGDDYRTWVFRVDNGLSGKDREYFDLAYRKLAPDAHLLYLKRHHRSRSSSSR